MMYAECLEKILLGTQVDLELKSTLSYCKLVRKHGNTIFYFQCNTPKETYFHSRGEVKWLGMGIHEWNERISNTPNSHFMLFTKTKIKCSSTSSPWLRKHTTKIMHAQLLLFLYDSWPCIYIYKIHVTHAQLQFSSYTAAIF